MFRRILFPFLMPAMLLASILTATAAQAPGADVLAVYFGAIDRLRGHRPVTRRPAHPGRPHKRSSGTLAISGSSAASKAIPGTARRVHAAMCAPHPRRG